MRDGIRENLSENAVAKSTLISRNITISGRRTSVRLEPEMWNALREIASLEACAINDLCSLVSQRKRQGTSLTAAIRVFLMLYYRAAATEEGHTRAGHGDFRRMMLRAGVAPDIQDNARRRPKVVTGPEAAQERSAFI